MRQRRSASFKAQVVQEVLKDEKTIAQIAEEYGLHPSQISQWKAAVLKSLPALFERKNTARSAEKTAREKKLKELDAEIAKLTTEVAWLRRKSGLEPD